jgi:ATP-dependent exoDNAse (exonuclease V) beta subunit
MKKKILGTYSDSKQLPLNNRKGKGYVYVEKIVADDEHGDTKETFSKTERGEIVTEKVRNLIGQIRDRGVFEDKDIAILVRRKEEVRLIVKMLLEMGINVESELTVNVKNHPLVRELVSFLRYINVPDDDLSFASFISGTIFCMQTSVSMKEILEWITRKRTTDNEQHLYDLFRTDYPGIWNDYFEVLFKTSGYLPLYEFIVFFLRKWSLFDNFPNEAPYFHHICELIKNREVTEENNLSAFIHFLDDNDANPFAGTSDSEKPFLLKTSESSNAVKVLTIHKAKGLEFPVVILPFMKLDTFAASDERDKTKFFTTDDDTLRLLYIKKDFTDISPRLKDLYGKREASYLLDELNNIYVAFTRAEEELYIFLTDSKGYKKNHLIDYLFNLDYLKKSIHRNTIEMGVPCKFPAALEKSQDVKQGRYTRPRQITGISVIIPDGPRRSNRNSKRQAMCHDNNSMPSKKVMLSITYSL